MINACDIESRSRITRRPRCSTVGWPHGRRQKRAMISILIDIVMSDLYYKFWHIASRRVATAPFLDTGMPSKELLSKRAASPPLLGEGVFASGMPISRAHADFDITFFLISDGDLRRSAGMVLIYAARSNFDLARRTAEQNQRRLGRK